MTVEILHDQSSQDGLDLEATLQQKILERKFEATELDSILSVLTETMLILLTMTDETQHAALKVGGVVWVDQLV